MFRTKYLLTGLLMAGLVFSAFNAPRAFAAADNKDKTAPSNPTQPPAGDKEEMADLMSKLAEKTVKIFELGYTVAHVEVDRLQKGQVYSASRNLYGGNGYIVVGIGGRGIGDLDMKLEDAGGTTIAKDTEADNVPIVQVTPKTTGNYTVKVAAAAIERGFDPENEYYFCWIIAFKNK
jgi:hypothetical protein